MNNFLLMFCGSGAATGSVSALECSGYGKACAGPPEGTRQRHLCPDRSISAPLDRTPSNEYLAWEWWDKIYMLTISHPPFSN
jgi:hypothetical protein